MENKWIASQDVISTNFHEITEQERIHVLNAMPSNIEKYMIKDNIGWVYHDGDLIIDGSFDNRHYLIINGHLTIRGDYDDYHDGHLIVLGDVHVEHFLNQGYAYIHGKINASGLIYAYYNSYNFDVVNGVSAKGVIISDKGGYQRIDNAGFYICEDCWEDDYDYDDNIEKAKQVLVPELYDDVDASYLPGCPTDETVRAWVCGNKPIFK